MNISRHASYFAAGSNRLFGWYHYALTVPQLDCVAVICNPIGHEYAHCHRSIRHLADQLAASGIPALRFDYSGTGDSPGLDVDADRVGNWQREIVGAIEFARELRIGNTGSGTKVCLIGVRLGASLAAIANESHPADFLVMWNPCVSGRRFVRELQAISAMSTSAKDSSTTVEQPMLESAGFAFSNETILQLHAVNLLDLKFNSAGKVLLLDRDDLSVDATLHDHLVESGVQVDYRTVPGYAGMVAEPQFTVVPHQAIGTIASWLSSHCAVLRVRQSAIPVATANSLVLASSSHGGEKITEQICHFGADQHLFGILTKPNEVTEKPLIVLFNAGCVHHIGPNRLYVTLCRHLASEGFSAFRFDLESLGDSVLRGAGRENHPYPDHAVSDGIEALAYLREKFGVKTFIVAGLCSGAHTAFHVGLYEAPCSENRAENSDPTMGINEQVTEVVLINPLTFRWTEGMSLDTVKHFWAVQRYRKSAFSSSSWRKLLSGKVDLLNLVKTLQGHGVRTLGSRFSGMIERFSPKKGTQLSQDFRQLVLRKRHIRMIIAEGDPGEEILIAEAKYIVKCAHRNGQMETHHVRGGDHTFTQFAPRMQLVRYLVDALGRRHKSRTTEPTFKNVN